MIDRPRLAKLTAALILAAALGSCGQSATAPAAVAPAPVLQPSGQSATPSAAPGRVLRGSAPARIDGRDRSKYSVILF